MLLGAVFVLMSLRQPAIDTYSPTTTAGPALADSLTGTVRYTIDASSPDRWRYFSFARGSVVEPRAPLDWDLAFRRFHIIANGGHGFAGQGGIANLGKVSFDSVTALPASGYVPSTADKDSSNAATAHWYRYSFTSHLLKPKPEVWAVRTARGGYALLRVVSYYCPGPQPGCVTFDYAYLGTGPASRFQFSQ